MTILCARMSHVLVCGAHRDMASIRRRGGFDMRKILPRSRHEFCTWLGRPGAVRDNNNNNEIMRSWRIGVQGNPRYQMCTNSSVMCPISLKTAGKPIPAPPLPFGPSETGSAEWRSLE